jgi:hypothetical protein
VFWLFNTVCIIVVALFIGMLVYILDMSKERILTSLCVCTSKRPVMRCSVFLWRKCRLI